MKLQNSQTLLTETIRKAVSPWAKDIKAAVAKANQLREETSKWNSFAAEDYFEDLRSRAVSGDPQAKAEFSATPDMGAVKRRFLAMEAVCDDARTEHLRVTRHLWESAAAAILPELDGVADAAQAQLDAVMAAVGEPRQTSVVASAGCDGLRRWCRAIMLKAEADLGLIEQYL